MSSGRGGIAVARMGISCTFLFDRGRVIRCDRVDSRVVRFDRLRWVRAVWDLVRRQGQAGRMSDFFDGFFGEFWGGGTGRITQSKS